MNADMISLLGQGFWETLIMVLGSGFLGSLIGIPLGVLLHVTDKGGLMPKLATNTIVGVIVNAVRSTPFIILLVAIYPLTRLIVGTTIGTTATIVPLVIGVAPFIARLVETSLREVDKGLIEAAQSMGATDYQIITKVLLPEAMPGIVASITIAIVTLVGYSAMAGAIGGGGLGDIGIRYGHNRYMPEVMWTVVLILVVFVQVIQSVGDWCVKRVSKR
ncbi:MAG: ABC transporter permease [Burkholderiaceae bacterium]|nr:ABC transporter permease [Burkholderiaceae bacterium]MBR5458684.1 ABC transporter permease [Burkholderiaceae bacterium]